MDKIAVGKRIREARENAGLTQEALADILNLSSTHISVIERGIKLPKLDTFVKIANALDVPADALLQDVVDRSRAGALNVMTEDVMSLPPAERRRVMNVLRALIE